MKSSFLPDDFVTNLQSLGRHYAALGKAQDRRQWAIAELVNRQWELLPMDVQQEVEMSGYYHECSHWVNEAVGFPLVSASGETLRRWCEVAYTFAGLPGLEAMRETLSFEHFTQAKILYNKGKVSVPSYALAKAIELELSADDMRRFFDPPEPPDMFARATGWLDLLETYAAQYANGKAPQIAFHVGEIRKLLA